MKFSQNKLCVGGGNWLSDVTTGLNVKPKMFSVFCDERHFKQCGGSCTQYQIAR